MEHDAAHELDVIVDHIPALGMSRYLPGRCIVGMGTLKGDVGMLLGELTIEILRGDDEFLLGGEAAGSLFDNGKCAGEMAIKDLVALLS